MNEFELRRQLRELRTDAEPAHDLWPAIEARLPASQPTRGGFRWLPLALAASLAVAALVAHQTVGPTADPDAGRAPALVRGSEPLPRAATALDIEYRAALAGLPPVALPPELRDTALLLDDSALELREALRQQPDSRFLLDQLRRTYALRLQLGRPASFS